MACIEAGVRVFGMSKEDRKSEYDEAYSQGASHWSGWHTAARTDLRAYAGDAWTAKDKRLAQKQNRELMSFPQLRRVIKWLTGYERDHRLSITYDPMEGGDLDTASQLNMVALWALQLHNGYNVISDAFEGALKTGMNLVNVYNDRNINTKFERFMYNQFILDPTFTRVDLEDCHYGILRKYVTNDAAKMILPGREKFIDGFKDRPSGTDEKFAMYSRPTLYGEKLLSYDEFQRRSTRLHRIIIIKPTGDEVVFDGSLNELDSMLRDLVMRGLPPEMISVVQRWDPTIEVTTYLEGEEANHAVDPFDIGTFSFAPVVAYLDPEHEESVNQIQSIIHGLIDAQRVSDRKMMSEIAWVEQQIGAGLDYEQGALVDDRDAMKTGSGSPRLFAKDALAENRARDRIVPDIPPGIRQLREDANNEIPKMVGFNPEMMGFPANQNVKIAGVLAKLRMGAGLIGLRDLFDNRSLTVKMVGTVMLKLIQQYPPDKIMRITNREPTDTFYTRQFGKYDVAIAEGMLGDTQRGVAYAELVALREMANNSNQPSQITEKMLIAQSPIQQPLELLKAIEEGEKLQAEAKARQDKLNEALQQLAIAQAQAEIEQQKALTQQQITGARENETEAAYDRVKTAAEIQDLQSKGSLEVLRMAVDLEKARIGASKSEKP